MKKIVVLIAVALLAGCATTENNKKEVVYVSSQASAPAATTTSTSPAQPTVTVPPGPPANVTVTYPPRVCTEERGADGVRWRCVDQPMSVPAVPQPQKAESSSSPWVWALGGALGGILFERVILQGGRRCAATPWGIRC